MEYKRVIPRDFFNDAKLLKCMGHLALRILDCTVPEGINIIIHDSGLPFKIHLNFDGGLEVINYPVIVNGKSYRFKTVYNAKTNFPFYCEDEYVDYLVFNENGEFSEEFINHFKNGKKSKRSRSNEPV